MINKIIKHLEDTLLHKQYVLESAKKLCKYLIEVGRIDDAIEPDEIFALIQISDKESLKDAKVQLDDAKKNALKIHWAKNSHHPEYYNDPSLMSDMDLLEMACDCNARSMEFGTDLLEFIDIRQKERFRFPKNESKVESTPKQETDYRTLLINHCKNNGLDLNAISKEYSLSRGATNDDFRKVYEELCKM